MPETKNQTTKQRELIERITAVFVSIMKNLCPAGFDKPVGEIASEFFTPYEVYWIVRAAKKGGEIGLRDYLSDHQDEFFRSPFIMSAVYSILYGRYQSASLTGLITQVQ